MNYVAHYWFFKAVEFQDVQSTGNNAKNEVERFLIMVNVWCHPDSILESQDPIFCFTFIEHYLTPKRMIKWK